MSCAADRIGRVAVLVLVVVATGCGLAADTTSRPADAGASRNVWVVRHAWHTRIAVRRADVDLAVWPEAGDVGEAAFVEVGWGDRDFYSKPRPSVWDALDPIVRATPAALHVGGFDARPGDFVPGTAAVRLRLSADGFERLVRFVHDEYARDAKGRPVRMGRGYYERSWFYLARSRYHVIFANSNRWVATALREAGLPMEPGIGLTADAVMAQAAALAAR